MELSEEAKAEIKEAVRILKEDGIQIHKSYRAFLNSLDTEKEPGTGEKPSEAGEKPSETGEKPSETGEKPGNKETEGSPPPEKPEEKVEKPKKAGLWWGSRE